MSDKPILTADILVERLQLRGPAMMVASAR